MKRNLMIAVALAAVIAGVVIAVASGGSHHHDRAALRASGKVQKLRSETQSAAAYLGISPGELHQRLRAGKTLAQIAQATPGKSSNGLIHALLEAHMQRLHSLELSKHNGQLRLQRLHTRIAAVVAEQRVRRGNIPTTADYLGLSEAELRARLRAGKTLAQIAKASKGISASALIDMLLNVKATRLRLALAAGTITAAEEKTALASLRTRVKREVSRKLLQAG